MTFIEYSRALFLNRLLKERKFKIEQEGTAGMTLIKDGTSLYYCNSIEEAIAFIQGYDLGKMLDESE